MKKVWTAMGIALLMMVELMVVPMQTVSAAQVQNRMLSINYSLLQQIGTQASGSSSCSCFALAYARTILDGYAANWADYNEYGNDQYNVSCVWSQGGYDSHSASSELSVYQMAYEAINNGQPFIVHVDTAAGHWVTIVGYQNVVSTDQLSADNFLIIDPSYSDTLQSAKPLSNHYSGLKNYGEFYYASSSKGGSVSTVVSGSNDSPLGSELGKGSGYCLNSPVNGVIVGSNVSVWSKASKNSTKLATYENGTAVTITGVTRNKSGSYFYEVDCNGQTGYIFWQNVYY